MRRHSYGINALSWDDSGTILLTGSYDCSVVLWDAASDFSAIIGLPTGHRDGVLSATFVPGSGAAKIVSSDSGSIHLLDSEPDRYSIRALCVSFG